MIVTEVQDLIESYTRWLLDNTVLQQAGGACVAVSTPFLDRHNDHIEIFIEPAGSGYRLTDDSYTLNDLRASGCDVSSGRRLALLDLTLKGFGVGRDEDEIFVAADSPDFPRKKHTLLQALLAVNDLFYTSRPTVLSLYEEDVRSWLDSTKIRYVPNIQCVGLSGFPQVFKFVVPRSDSLPETYLQPIANPTKQAMQEFVFRWNDTKNAREGNVHAIVLLNDAEKTTSQKIVTGFENYGIEAVPFSMRTTIESRLAA